MQQHADLFLWLSMLVVITIFRAETHHESRKNSLLALKVEKQFFTKVEGVLNIAILAASTEKHGEKK